MDTIVFPLVLSVLLIPAAAISALLMVVKLKTRVLHLEVSLARSLARIGALEARGVGPAPEPVAAPPVERAAVGAEPDELPETAEETPEPESIPAETAGATSAATAARREKSAATAAPGLEERIGTRWAVWIGGIALGLGLIFLVQYSIEQGLFGPAARLAMAGLLSSAVVAAGELLRRRDLLSGRFAGFPSAHVPAILTAAGASGLFATVWAAHGLHDFLGSATAFVALGAVALATMAAALVHGPWLGVLGILAGYATPILVASREPAFGALVIHLGVVTAAAFGVARLRLWKATAATALAAVSIWVGIVLLDAPTAAAMPWAMILAVVVFALVAGILVAGLDARAPMPVDVPIDRFGLAALAVGTALVLAAFGDGSHSTALRLACEVGLVATLAGLAALAWTTPAVVPAIAVAAGAAVLAAAAMDLDVARTLVDDTFARGADGLVALRPRAVAHWLGFNGAIGAALLGLGLFGAMRATPSADRSSGWFALAGTAGPLLSTVVAWGRVAAFESHTAFAAVAALLALVFTGATLRTAAREEAERPSLAVAITAVGAIAALGTAFAIALDRAALTVALALMIPAIAWVWRMRPLGALRGAAAAVAIVVLGRLLWDPRLVDDIGRTPIFNALLLGYGVPAAGTAWAVWVFRTAAADLARATVESASVIFTGLFAMIEIRHLVTGGDIFSAQAGIVELGLYVAVAFVMSAGTHRVAGRFGSRVMDLASRGLGVFTVAVAMLGCVIAANPLFGGDDVSFGGLALAYGAPTIAGAVAARMGRLAGRPAWFVGMQAVAAYVLGFTWVTLMVRFAFHGARLDLARATSAAEVWSYSAAWLALGVATLVVGLRLDSKPVRLLSGLVIAGTACKVFLIDLSGAEGVWRAFSFIGLGLVLIGIALVYQRWIFPPKRSAGETSPEA